MGNLGKYQDFTTAAARAGGVDKLLKELGDIAVDKAAPKILAKGAAVGVAVGGTVVGLAGALAVHRRDRRRALEVREVAVKDQLRAALAENEENVESTDPAPTDAEPDPDSDNPGAADGSE